MEVITDDVSRIRELMEKWAKAVREKDIDGVLAFHSAAILLFDVVEPVQSRGIDGYRKSWIETFFPWYGDEGKFELSELEITAGADIAFCHGLLACSGTERGEKASFEIRLTVCLKKTGYQWIVMHEHHSQAFK